MKLTTKQLRKIIKEEVAAQKREVAEMVDPAMIAAAQQAFVLDPKAFRMVWGLIQAIPSIPGRWKELSAKEAEKKAASKEDPELAKLLDALGEFRGEAFTDDEKTDLQGVYHGDTDALERLGDTE